MDHAPSVLDEIHEDRLQSDHQRHFLLHLRDHRDHLYQDDVQPNVNRSKMDVKMMDVKMMSYRHLKNDLLKSHGPQGDLIDRYALSCSLPSRIMR
jgi:hypothetical protein